MNLPDDMSIERLTLRVIDRSLPKREWTHEGHFAAALWLLVNRPQLARPEEFRAIIMAYNDATGTLNSDTTGYHHTITRASVRAASRHLAVAAADRTLHESLRSLMASRLGRPDWLLRHWNRETLFSIAARRRWVEPDICALPF